MTYTLSSRILLLLQSAKDAFLHLTPIYQIRSPILFIVYISSILATLNFLAGLISPQTESAFFTLSVAIVLWLTVLFANFAEAIADNRAKAQAKQMRNTRGNLIAKKLPDASHINNIRRIPACELKKHDIILVEAGDYIPADGEVIDGVASVDESAVTGESAPVIREPSSSERSTVTCSTQVLSDWIIVRVSANQGEGYIDYLNGMIEGTHRQKTPNEIALEVFLIATTIGFLITCTTLYAFSLFGTLQTHLGNPIGLTTLIGLMICLTPTTIGGLLSAIGIAGMNRLMKANVIATSGRAIEAAGDVTTLLLDKTGTITYGNRQAVTFYPAPGISMESLIYAALIASVADETPEGRSIVDLSEKRHNMVVSTPPHGAVFIPFSADTRLSGVQVNGTTILKGAEDAIEDHITKMKASVPKEVREQTDLISRQGGTPLLVAEGARVLGVIHLKDIIKSGIKERISYLRIIGVKTVMITGDNPLTAAAIAAESGVDDFISQAIPETKLALIRKLQDNGEVVAMVGDGSNDAPALAQADVAIVMNSGSQAAKDASNMVDLDSNPTKLLEIVKIGKQLLMTRGTITTFSLTSDIAKYAAIIPAAFVSTYPVLGNLNVMNLSTPQNAILSSLIFNAFIIILLTPLAIRGVPFKPVNSDTLLRHNLFIYGLGGLITPFIGIKLIDILLSLFLGR